MINKRIVSVAACAAIMAGSATATYPLLWRKWCVTWGTTAEEPGRAMPGDDLLPDPDLLTTRAVTIDAVPGDVWPWLVQMGPGRGGAYTYDWVENLLGLDMHSAEEILPRFQHLAVGDVLPLGDHGPRMRVAVLLPRLALVLASEDGRWVWAFVLDELAGQTRLISRNRIAAPDASWVVRLFDILVMEPGSLVMERKMLLGIRERAERLAARTRSVA